MLRNTTFYFQKCSSFIIFQDDPAIFVGTSVQDNHVPCWIPLQWVAKRRELNEKLTSPDKLLPLLCHVEMKGGHHGYDFESNMQKVFFQNFFLLIRNLLNTKKLNEAKF